MKLCVFTHMSMRLRYKFIRLRSDTESISIETRIAMFGILAMPVKGRWCLKGYLKTTTQAPWLQL